MEKRLICLFVLLWTASALALSCDALRGEDGLDGHNGLRGAIGPDGLDGMTGELGLPCWRCIGKWALAPGSVTADKLAEPAVGNSVQFADQAVGTAQLAPGLGIGNTQLANGAVTNLDLQNGAVNSQIDPITGLVTTSKLANGAVTLGKIGADQVNATHIASGSVGAANVAPGAVEAGDMAPGAVELGDIASNAVDSWHIAPASIETRHISMGAINHVWRKIGGSEDSIVNVSSYVPMKDMELTLSDGGNPLKGGPYLIIFNASFYSTGCNNDTYVELALVDYNNPDTVLEELNIQHLATARRTYAYIYSPSNSRYGCYGTGCSSANNNHIHLGAQHLGSAALQWAGDFRDMGYSPPYRIQVRWLDDSGNTIYQMRSNDVENGQRILTVIEFARAIARQF